MPDRDACDEISLMSDTRQPTDRGSDDGETGRPGVVAMVFVGLIRVYRLTLSALIGRSCRFLPTCSDYGETAIRRFGAWRGGWLALFRFLRCRPGGRHGFDPVPDEIGRHGLRFWRYARYGGGETAP